MTNITPQPIITKMASFSVVSDNYAPLASGYVTRKGAVSACATYGGARVIQGGYDENGNRYFREVYPRIMRTWQERFQPEPL